MINKAMFKERFILILFSLYIFIINYIWIFSYHEKINLYYVFIIVNTVLIMSFVSIVFIKGFIKIPGKSWILIIFLISIIFIDISKIYNAEFNFMIFTYVIFGIFIPSTCSNDSVNRIIKANILGLFPYFLYSLYNFSTYGTYYNNGVGLLLSVNIYSLIIHLENIKSHKNKITKLLLLIYILINYVMVYYSASRNALLASILMLIYYIAYLFTNSKLSFKKIMNSIMSVFVIAFFLIKFKIIDKIYNLMFYKWGSNKADFSFSGRTQIWGYTLNNFKFLGGGSNYFADNFGNSHGHNFIINILGFYGLIPFILMSAIMIYMIYLFVKIKDIRYRMFCILFIVINTFEGVTGKNNYSYFQMLFFLYLGIWIKIYKSDSNKNI